MAPWEKDVLATRLEGLRRSLQITDRVLVGDSRVTLQFEKVVINPNPAHSIGSAITVCLAHVPNPGSNSGLVHILGLNYHEVAHVRYSVEPEEFKKRLFPVTPQRRFQEAYNVLEEARVETLLCAKYAKLRKYFAYPVIHHIVNVKENWPNAFLLLHGRRYLPRRVRDSFREIFLDTHTEEATDRFAELIDKYRLLSFDTVAVQAVGARIVNEFAALLGAAQVPPLPSHDQTGAQKGTSGKKVAQESAQDAAKAVRQSEEQEDTEEDGEDGSGFDDQEEEQNDGAGDLADDDEVQDQGSDETGGSSPEDESGEEGEPDGSGGGEDSEDKSDQDDAGRGDEGEVSGDGGGEAGGEDGVPVGEGRAQSSGAGTGRGSHALSDSREIEEALSGILEAVLDDQDVRQDVAGLREAMEDAAALGCSLERYPGRESSLVPVLPEMFAEADRVKDALRQLWARMESGWSYGLSEGSRLDMNRAALARDADGYDSIYDDWEPGQQENSGICTVILVDFSESMGFLPVGAARREPGTLRPIAMASRHVWEIMYALQEVDAETTVIAYNTGAQMLYERGETVTSAGYMKLDHEGGTNPSAAMDEARRILTLSEMPHKLLVVVSDGDWDAMGVDKSLDALGSECVKLVILIGGTKFKWAHKFDIVARTDGPIFEAMADAVVKITERNAQ